jgi:hypothetical protein
MNENGSTRLYGNLTLYCHTLNHSLLSSIFSYRQIQGFHVSFGEVCILPSRYGPSQSRLTKEKFLGFTHVQVCCRSMALFESIVDMLAEFAPILSFFRRSHDLFKQMSSKDLEAAIKAVCEEMIHFCLGVVKYCRRKSTSEHPQAFPCKPSAYDGSKLLDYAIPARSGG